MQEKYNGEPADKQNRDNTFLARHIIVTLSKMFYIFALCIEK